MRLRVGAGTDVGRVRPFNEDAFLLRAREGLFVVCDGMGGAPAGDVASQMAIDVILRELREPPREPVGTSSSLLPHTKRLADAVRHSNQFIYSAAQSDPDRLGMGTTVVGAWICKQIAGVAHVGDSRAYLWHDGCLKQLTRDHSLLEAHVEAGLAEEAAGLSREQQSVLVRVLGREPTIDVDVREVPVRSGDYVLLCSDGLTRMVSEAELATVMRERLHPQRICDDLIALANRNGGADNITVVVVEVAGGWWYRLLDRWKRQ